MDLMSGSYSFEVLQKKYGNFLIPAAKLKIGGSNLLELTGVMVESIQITLSLKAAGCAYFYVTSGYDYKNGSFDSALKSKVVLGKEVSVELGYGSSLVTVFKGFVAAVGTEFDVDTGVSYSITAMDARRLMQTDNLRIIRYNVKHYSDAVSEVLKRYKKLCTPVVDATTENLEGHPLAQSSSDYDFIVNKIIGEGKADREFFIVADKAYFRKPRGSSSPVVTLGVGSGLKSFQKNSIYLNEKIQVIGREEGTHKILVGESTAKAADQQVAALSEPGIYQMAAPDCHVQGELKARAAALADREKAKNQQASAVCVGIPEIVPGRYLKIERLDSTVNRSYYITEVIHEYNRSGFTTKIEMEGWS